MSNLRNIVGQKSTTTGAIGVAATIDLDGAAVDSFNTFAAAGCVDGTEYTVTIKDGSNRQVGRATYNAGTPDTLTVVSIFASTNSGSAITLTGDADVFIDAAAEDVGGLVLVQQEVIGTAVSAVDFDLPVGYSRFHMVIENLSPVADATFFTAQLSTDGGTTILDTGYYSEAGSLAGSGSTGYDNQAVLILFKAIKFADKTFGYVDFISTATEFHARASRTFWLTATTDFSNEESVGYRSMSGKADFLRLAPLSQNLAVGSKFSLYAYKES